MNETAEAKTITVTVRFPARVHDAVKAAAEKNRRSISSQIIFMAEEQLRADA